MQSQVDHKQRCAWAGEHPAMVRYHDAQWGTPVHDDRLLFEFLILEGAQAGLSWETILKDAKRTGRRSISSIRRLSLDTARTILLVCWRIPPSSATA